MAKGHEAGEKTKETHKEPHAGGEAKKAPEHKAPSAPSKAKGQQSLPGACLSWGCKAHPTRFNFCDEHYDHFKFGLIKKTGEPVPDYEKKFGHYMAHKASQKSAKKVA
jgi:hypothetical protein